MLSVTAADIARTHTPVATDVLDDLLQRRIQNSRIAYQLEAIPHANVPHVFDEYLGFYVEDSVEQLWIRIQPKASLIPRGKLRFHAWWFHIVHAPFNELLVECTERPVGVAKFIDSVVRLSVVLDDL
jgi:hypothetical protein